MKCRNSIFEGSDRNGFHHAGFDAALAECCSAEVFRCKSAAVEQGPALLPMRFGLRRLRRLRNQHEILDQARAYGLRHDNEKVDVVRADDKDRGRKEGVGVGEDAPNGGPILAVDLNVAITRAGLFKLSFVLPEGLEVEAISGAALGGWTEASEAGMRVITLQLNGRTIGEQNFALTFTGAAPAAQKAWMVPIAASSR